ncbi:MAG: hypothetical protein AAF297_02615 [Planctomycetota bacterium]
MRSISADFIEGVRDLSGTVKLRKSRNVRGRRIRDDLGTEHHVKLVDESAPATLTECREAQKLLQRRARWHYRRMTHRGTRLVHRSFVVMTVIIAFATAAYLARSAALLESRFHSVVLPIGLVLFAIGLIAFERSPLASPRQRRAHELSKLWRFNVVFCERWYTCPVCTYLLAGSSGHGDQAMTCPECSANWVADRPLTVQDTR